MRKFVLIASIVIFVLEISSEARAIDTAGYCNEDETCLWKIDDGILTISAKTGAGNVTMNDYYVTYAFHGTDDGYENGWVTSAPWARQGVTRVVIGDGVVNIGENAFSGETLLTDIDIPNTLTTIGEYAFREASSLTSIDMPNVKIINEGTFAGASSLSNVNMPMIETIANDAFLETSALTHLELPSSLTTIDSNAFRTNSDLEIIIPNSLDFSGWSNDALNDWDEGFTIFKCKNNSESCYEKIKAYIETAANVYSDKVIFDAGDHKECLHSESDDYYYYHTGTGCTEIPDDGNISCSAGYADYNGNCYSQLPFSKKRWTPAEAAQWLHDGNDNFVVLTFKK